MAKSKKKKKNKNKQKSYYDELINIIYNDSRKGYSIKNIVEKRKLTILDISGISDGKTYIVQLVSKKIQNDKTNPDHSKILIVYFLLTTDDILENKDECILQKNIIITTITKRWFTFPNLKEDSIEKLIRATEDYNNINGTNIATDFDINDPYDFYKRLNELPKGIREEIGLDKTNNNIGPKEENNEVEKTNKEENVVQAENQIKEEVVARRKRKTRKRLTKELVEAIYADSQKGLLSYSDIAKMYSVSASTVGRIANKQHTLQRSGIEVIFNEEEKDIVKELIEEPKKIITPNEPLVTVDEELMAIPMEDIKPEDFHRAIKYVRMGMVADRHNMPTNKYVFESVPPDLMFDYDKMDKIAMRNILKEVTDNEGNVKAGIALYVTGLTGALGSIAKVCYDCGVNLTLLHYNSDTKKYIEHPIYKNFIKGDILPAWFPNGMREVYTYKDHISEFIIDGQIIYEVTECHFTNINTKEYDRNTYLFLSKEYAWKYYNQRSYIAGKSNLPINIYLSKYYISNRSFTKEATLRKAINVI